MKQRTLLALLVFVVLPSGCLPKPQPTTVPQALPTHTPAQTPTHPTAVPTATTTPLGREPISEVVPASFADYEPYVVQIEPAVRAYSTDPSQVVNPDLLRQLSDAQRAYLSEHGFVVVPNGPEQMYAIYKQAKEAGIPVLVTTDSLLHAFHILYDYTLRAVEIEYLVADLRVLNKAMLDHALSTLNDAKATEAKEASERNAAFFAVASALLDPDAQIPQEVEQVVQQELALIEAHQSFAQSPIFGYTEDYSQYVPRGHYTRNETFERYFRCMMWYGRIGFHPTGEDVEQARRETRQAVMITAGLFEAAIGNETAIDVWERIYEPTVFFVGRADDLTPYDYRDLAQSLFGGPLERTMWEDQGKLDAFREATRDLDPPRIVGGYVEDRQDAEEATRSFRFMGQRFVYDSYLFQQLVYDKVKTYQGDKQPFTLSPSDAGPIRGVPRGLDIAAVFGSERALDILTKEGDTQYQGYDEQMVKLRQETLALPAEQWVENLYWGWLYSLRPLLDAKDTGYPVFMQNQAWTDKDLFAFLGSWAELRHDTILYAKQSYTIRATSIMVPPEPARGYVEPQPEVYARLAALARQMRAGLTQRGLLNDEFTAKLNGLEDLLAQLKDISEKELSNQPLSDEEYELIRNIGQILEQLTTFSEETEQGVSSETDDKMAIVADVHTDSNTEQVLEEGVGSAFTVYAIVPHGDETQAVIGALFSYYEFRHPMSDRLTDEKWQAMPKPPLAPWTQSFIIE